jgi:4-methylaminobutanoate oxidase (formaldehyde-forming)
MIRRVQATDVVVIGAGAFGASTAYHLARRGASVTLVDQHALGSQTSPRAAGLTSKAASSLPVMAQLRHEACDALERFEQDIGRSIDFHRSGSLKAAYTEAGETRLRRDLDLTRQLGVEATMIAAAEAERLAPHFRAGPARAIGHVPSDGWIDPSKVAVGFAARAQELGARALPFTRVTTLLRDGDRVTGVTTTQGPISAPVVVDAAGAWAAAVAAAHGLRLPLVPVRHQLFVTEPIAGVEPLQPIVRLLEASVYVRYAAGGLLFGGYEDEPRIVDSHALPPGFQIADLELDLSVLRALVDEVGDHFPVLRTAPIAVHRGGLPTMTPDGYPVLGPVAGLAGFHVASGCCVGGLTLSPAAGRALSDLILDGKSDPDLAPLSVERFRGRYEPGPELAAACVERYARKYTK